MLAVAPRVAAGNPEEAAALKSKADEAFDGRRYADALGAYQASLAKHRDARLHYNVAQAFAALERFPEALASYQAFIAEAQAGTLNESQQSELFTLVEALKDKIARLQLHCSVDGARVLVRGRVVGKTPLIAPVVLNAGAAKVEVVAEGYKPFEANIELPGAKSRELRVVLQRVDFSGAIAVAANVAGARVFVDGVAAGVAPTRVRVKQGTHVVEVRAAGHESQRSTVTVEPAKRVELSVALEPTPDRTLVYLGFGVGATGVAAGTVSGILALSRFDKAKEQCDQTAKECGPAAQADLQSSKTWGTVSTVAFGVGAAGLGLGVYGLLTTAPRRGLPPRVEVVMIPGGAGVRGGF